MSVALGEPRATVLQVSKVHGFIGLLILKVSFLALRAGTCQRVCVGRFPTGMLDGLTEAILLLEGGREGQTGTNPHQTRGKCNLNSVSSC